MTVKNALKQLAPKKTEEVKEQAAEETPIDLKEILDLISIRQYLATTVNNPAFDRPTVNFVSHSLILVDKKIVSLLQGEDFKEYINYGDVKQAVKEVVDQNNIRSGLQINSFGVFEKKK